MTNSKHLLEGEQVETVSFPLISEQAPISVKEGQSVWDVTQEQMRSLKLPTAEEIAAIREAAQREGYRAGEKAGLAAGQQQIQQSVKNLTVILQQMARPLENQVQVITTELAELVRQMVSSVVLRELKLDSSGIEKALEEALSAMDLAQASVTVRMSAQDAQLVKSHVEEGALNDQVAVVADAKVQPGGCLVESSCGRVDASVESRLQQVLDQLYSQMAVEPKPEPPGDSSP